MKIFRLILFMFIIFFTNVSGVAAMNSESKLLNENNKSANSQQYVHGVILQVYENNTSTSNEQIDWFSPSNIASLATLLSAIATLIIAWFTYRAARISIISANAAKKAADSAEQSIEVARESYTASERPWISVDAKVNSDLVKMDYGIDFGVIFSLKNHGRSPARNVHVLYNVVTLKVSKDQFSGSREKIYEQGRSGMGAEMGIQIFPSESKAISWKVPLTNDEIVAAKKTNKPSNNSIPSFYIIGSVFYQSVFSEQLYNTDFIYYVMDIGNPEFPKGTDIPLFDHTFPLNRIYLESVPYYKGTIN